MRLLDKHPKSNVFIPLRLFLAPLSHLFILRHLPCPLFVITRGK